jgi:DNA-binding transcriptional MerR regulator
MHIDLPEKFYYKIGEVAEAFKVNTSLLRFWEKEFKMLHPKKDKNGNRLYTKKDVEIFQQIHFFVKEKGYTLDGAKQKNERKKGFQSRVGVNRKPIGYCKIGKKLKTNCYALKNQLSNICNIYSTNIHKH